MGAKIIMDLNGYLGNSTSTTTWFLGPHISESNVPPFTKATFKAMPYFQLIAPVAMNKNDYASITLSNSTSPYITTRLNSNMPNIIIECDFSVYGMISSIGYYPAPVHMNDYIFITNDISRQLDGLNAQLENDKIYFLDSGTDSYHIKHKVIPGENVYIGLNARAQIPDMRIGQISNFHIYPEENTTSNIDTALTSAETNSSNLNIEISTLTNQYYDLINQISDINIVEENPIRINNLASSIDYLINHTNKKKFDETAIYK